MPASTLDVSALLHADATASDKAMAEAHIRFAGARVTQGAVVVFATETFYGLAALPQDASAVAKLATLKGRDKDKPIALIAADLAACMSVVEIPPRLAPLTQAFWPGPLTLLLPARAHLSHPIVVAHPQGHRIGVRVSNHPVACALARASGGLITATSANLSGQPAVNDIEALASTLRTQADIVLDAGRLPDALASSVVGLGAWGLEYIREGAIRRSDLERVYSEQAHG